jgi:hypothetical protein
MAIEQLSPVMFRRYVNRCSHCEKKNLPEPIVFAKLCRRTNKYVCDGCYSMTAGGLRVRWDSVESKR